ncbi:MAG: DNA-directed RNA polymerases II 24 kDa polypeptide (RNA polymerase II subunit 5) [Chrysothrix sp. TS-e1954]|nr:MAG: DNA-directed RNA polymerases II 24 kDa polypeptide (RNA polymerase II subunit 5) [Chrysothrix sp. TS-e1954]
MAVAESQAEKDMVRMWRAWRTAHEMCKDRGYEILDEELKMPLDAFREEYMGVNGFPDRKKMGFSARPSQAMIDKFSSVPDSIGLVWLEFNNEANVGIKHLRAFAHYIDEHNFRTGIFISAVNPTKSALKVIPSVLPNVIEVFNEQDLLVNITKHELVPRHVLLSVEEKKAVLQRYRVKENQLPRIQTTDPVARFLGLKRGQVVKIIRESVTAGRYASYRYVIG